MQKTMFRATLVGALALFVSAGSPLWAAPSQTVASAQGKNGPVKVAVTVDHGKITAVKVVEHAESRGISDPPSALFPKPSLKTSL